MSLAGEALSIGLMFPQSGPQAWAGLECIEAAEVTVRHLEEQGVLQSGQVTLLKGDVRNSETAVDEAQRFLGQGARLLHGTIMSDWVPAAARLAEERGALYWEAVAASDDITALGLRNFFRVNVSCTSYGRDIVQFAASVLAPGWNREPRTLRTSLIYQPTSFCRSLIDSVAHSLREAGMAVTGVHKVMADWSDFRPTLRRVQQEQPDLVVAAALGGPTPLLYEQSLDIGFAPPAFLGTGAWALEQKVESLGSDLHGVFAAGTPHVAAMSSARLAPRVRASLDNWKASTQTAHSFRTAVDRDLTVMALVALFEELLPRASSWTLDAMRRAAMDIDLSYGETILGYGLRLDERGNNQRAFAAVMQWQHGRLETVYPEVIATTQALVG